MILWVPGRLPGLNELLAGKASQNGSWNRYNQLKQQWYGQIKLLCHANRVESVGPGYFSFLFAEPDRRRDPDNIVSGGVKLLFDSMVGAGVLKGDSWSHVLGYVGYWGQFSGRVGCLVHWDAERLWSRESMEALLIVKTEKSA